MSQDEWVSGDDVSLFSIGTAVLRDYWRVIRWAIAGAVVAVLLAMTKPAVYVATASFVPQGNDVARSGLANLAGQFGVALPTSADQTQSPEFYTVLLRSHVLLERIVRDTLTVQEMGGTRVAFLDLLKISGASQQAREEKGITQLSRMISPSSSKTTGIVGIEVTSRWPSVSLAIASSLLEGVNTFNEESRQSQAATERKFIERRLALADTNLRAGEDRLQSFLTTNRRIDGSPELLFERDRLQRDITLLQQVFTSLTQSYEEARIREVRDTPAITTIESPYVPSTPAPRGRIVMVLVGLVLGGSIGVGLVLLAASLERRRRLGDAEAIEFMSTMVAVLAPARRFGLARRTP